MARIKYTIDGTTTQTWNHTTKLTTPSLILNDNGTLRYTPLFAVNNGAEGTLDNYWYYKCGALAVTHNGTKYRAAISRRYTNSVSSSISTTITHSGKTGTTTTTTSKTVSPSGSVYLSGQISPGGGTLSASKTVSYGVTFASNPSVRVISGCSVSWIGTSSCEVSVSRQYTNSGTSGKPVSDSASFQLSVTGNVKTTTTTYPNETKSATATGSFNYGVTYPSAPTLTVNSGGVTATNKSGNASFTATKSLSGTVAYGKSATLSQAFQVTFNGSFGLS